MTNFSSLERKIGYEFSDKTLLETAFTHSSYAQKHGGKDNERMEYLGDAVLELIVTEHQYAKSESAEGEMTQERQKLVSAEALIAASETLGLKGYLRYEGGADNLGKKTISDLFETLIAAVYLDGGMQAAKTVALPFVSELKKTSPQNYKKDLQEFLQKQKQPLPEYLVKKSGQDHSPTFEAAVCAFGKTGVGVGQSKKEAEQNAAKNLLSAIR